MLKLIKPKFWDQKKINYISMLFFPITAIVIAYIFLKKIILTKISFNIPIICIGNIYIGGTGKTPMSILLAKDLKKNGLNPVILRKYYKNHEDEYGLIKNNFNELLINKKRIDGVYEAEKKGYDILILDDGLQDYKIKKNLNIVCFNDNQLIGNGLVLPSGPLRESLNALKNINIVIINGEKNLNFERKILNINNNLEIYYAKYVPENIDAFKNKKLLALAGIGNPENFLKLLEKNKLNVEKKFFFPDHYSFTKNEIQNIIDIAEKDKLKIIMTEKDFFKINKFKFNKLDYLKVSLKLNNKENLINRIKTLYDQKI